MGIMVLVRIGNHEHVTTFFRSSASQYDILSIYLKLLALIFILARPSRELIFAHLVGIR